MFHGLPHVVEAIEQAFDDSYDPDTLARVAWSTIAEPGDPRVGALIRQWGAADALDALVDVEPHGTSSIQLDELRAIALPRLSLPTIVAALAVTVEQQFRLLTPVSVSWPQQLADLGDGAPVALWVRGDHSLLRLASVAVTGSRTASGFGFRACSEIAWGLADRAHIIIAGGSYGIDTAAHRAALKAGGRTVALLASPVDVLFPDGNQELLEQIATDGAMVSERPPNMEVVRWRFTRRNQLLGALALKTIIVEASERSGALATADQAHRLGRPVGAVPGPLNSALSAGCYELLRHHHAVPITTVADAFTLGGI